MVDMSEQWPKIVGITRTRISPWMDVLAREVQSAPHAPVDTYFAIGQPDYLVALALTDDGRVILVRQYRPAIERFCLELPAGLLEEGEDPVDAIARELMEETGYATRSIELIGRNATCASRISNTTFSFFIKAGERVPNFVEEPGVSVVLVSPSELREFARSGEFGEQTQLGVLALAMLSGLICF
jgi:ADP-ribose pyrophosphatase